MKNEEIKNIVANSKAKLNNLRLAGVDVRISHKRKSRYEFALQKMGRGFHVEEVLEEKGGETHVKLTKNGQIYIGVARCNKTDCYHKKYGVALALDRAIGLMGAYHEETPTQSVQKEYECCLAGICN